MNHMTSKDKGPKDNHVFRSHRQQRGPAFGFRPVLKPGLWNQTYAQGLCFFSFEPTIFFCNGDCNTLLDGRHLANKTHSLITCKVAYEMVCHLASKTRSPDTCKVACWVVGQFAGRIRSLGTCKVACWMVGHSLQLKLAFRTLALKLLYL